MGYAQLGGSAFLAMTTSRLARHLLTALTITAYAVAYAATRAWVTITRKDL